MAVTRAADGVFRAVNRAFEVVTGYTAGEIVGRSMTEIGFYAQGDRPPRRRGAGAPANAVQAVRRRIHTKSGATRSVLVAMEPLAVAGEPCLMVSLVDAAGPVGTPVCLEDAEAYRRLFEEGCAATFVLTWHERGRVGCVLEANESARRLLGYAGQELRQMTLADWDAPPATPPLQEILERFASGREHTFERYVRTKDGRTLCVEICGRLLAWRGGTALFAQVRDISERRWMEELRRFDEESLRAALARRNVALFRLDEQLQPSWTFAPRGRRTLGWLFGLQRPGQTVPTEIARLRRRLHAALSSGRPVRMNVPRPGPGGRFCEVSAQPLRDPAGRMVGFAGVVLDSGKRKRAQPGLLPAGGVFESLAESAPVGIFRTDALARLTYVNPAAQQLAMRTSLALVGRPLAVFVAPSDRPELLKYWRRLAAGRGGRVGEVRLVRPGGEVRWVVAYAQPRFGPQGLEEVVGSVIDITERRRQASILRALVEARSAPGSLLGNVVIRVASVLEQEFAFVLQTPIPPGEPARLAAFCREGALAEGIEMPLADGPCGELLNGDARTVPSGLARVAPHTVQHWADGANSAMIVPVTGADGLIGGYLGVMGRRPIVDADGMRRALELVVLPVATEIERRREVELRRRIEQRLAHSEKFEALGALAGGIAHDFNNIITAILNYTTLARSESATEAEQRTCLAKVTEAGRRAQDLVRQIMTFDRRYHASQSDERVPVALATVVSDALGLLRPAISSVIEIERRNHPSTPMVRADPTQLHQVVTNLCINAVQAIGDDVGRLTVEVTPVMVDQAMSQAVAGLTCGLHAHLTVSDTGGGMDAATCARIFDPYFTTKPEGEGTGLGLAVARRIVLAHGGAVDVSSRQGAGTILHVYLPATATASVASAADAGLPLPPGRGRRILLVDDDPLIGDSLRLLFERNGYRVSLFDCAPAALAAFWAGPHQFDLVLTEHGMPELTGLMLAEHIAHVQPKLPIIVMCGHADEVSVSAIRASGATERLVKPIDISALTNLASRLLG